MVALASDSASSTPRSAYIHVPFCAHRCGYCDFTLVARRDDLIGPYLDALERDLARLGRPQEVDTLFFGGGTPTRLPPAELARLIELARTWFTLAPGYEFSVEANPSGLCDDRLRVLKDGGVTRISLGAQSFRAETLATLERDHRPDDIDDAVARIRRWTDNIALDLIFGVPGESLDQWRATLDRAVALGVPHVSTYGLTFEKGTAFWSRRMRGAIAQSPEELERAQYAEAMDRLADAGLAQYELSNFARSGFACRHNLAYWRQADYFGHGPGAARYRNGRREMNHRSVTTWIRRVHAGESPIAEVDELSAEDRAREAIVLGLRRIQGVDRSEFERSSGYRLDDLATDAIRRNIERGLIADVGGSTRLTREGRFVADSVMVDFL